MTRLIEFMIALVIVAVLFVGVGLMLPAARTVTVSADTNRSAAIVFDTVNNIQHLQDWNLLTARDPGAKLQVAETKIGPGARLLYRSANRLVGQGQWAIVDSQTDQRVRFAIQDNSHGHDKTLTFFIRLSDAVHQNAVITAEYRVTYGSDIFGRYAGLALNQSMTEELKRSLSRLTDYLATIPNENYRAQLTGRPILQGLTVTQTLSEDWLIVKAGEVDRNDSAIRQSIAANQEWLRRVAEANELELTAPIRLLSSAVTSEKYVFELAQPVRRKMKSSPAQLGPETTRREQVAMASNATGADLSQSIKLVLPDHAPVSWLHHPGQRAVFARYFGHAEGLNAARNALRAWAMVNGYTVADRPYDVWNQDLAQSFTDQGQFDLYWPIQP